MAATFLLSIFLSFTTLVTHAIIICAADLLVGRILAFSTYAFSLCNHSILPSACMLVEWESTHLC
jgi:hypothetical protein